jgi:hypothetical protein
MGKKYIKILSEDIDISGYSDEDFLEVFVTEFRIWIRRNHGDEVGEYPMSLLVKKYIKEFAEEYGLTEHDLRYSNTFTKMVVIGKKLVQTEIRTLPSLKKDIIFTERFKKIIDHFISNYNIPDFIKIHFQEDSPFVVRGWMTADFEPAMKYYGSLNDVHKFSREFNNLITNYLGFELGRPAHGNLDYYFESGFRLLGVDEWVKGVLNKKIKKEIKTLPGKSALHSMKFNVNNSQLRGEIKLVYSQNYRYGYRDNFKDELKKYLKDLGYNPDRLQVSDN